MVVFVDKNKDFDWWRVLTNEKLNEVSSCEVS